MGVKFGVLSAVVGVVIVVLPLYAELFTGELVDEGFAEMEGGRAIGATAAETWAMM